MKLDEIPELMSVRITYAPGLKAKFGEPPWRVNIDVWHLGDSQPTVFYGEGETEKEAKSHALAVWDHDRRTRAA